MRALFLSLGFFFVFMGFLGVIVPLLPTTIFFILAAASFAKSSPKLESRLLNHPRFGPPLRAWREKGSISRKNKAAAVALIWLSIGATLLLAQMSGPVVVLLLAAAAGLTAFLMTRPYQEADRPSTFKRSA